MPAVAATRGSRAPARHTGREECREQERDGDDIEDVDAQDAHPAVGLEEPPPEHVLGAAEEVGDAEQPQARRSACVRRAEAAIPLRTIAASASTCDIPAM